MSNRSPQYQDLNQGVWPKLEEAIREVQTKPNGKYAWVTAGQVFGENPPHVSRDGGKIVPVPEAYFAIVLDPVRYPSDTPTSVDLDCFIIPQNAPLDSDPDGYLSTREEIEQRTGLKFFDSWARTYPLGQNLDAVAQLACQADAPSRLMSAIASQRESFSRSLVWVESASARLPVSGLSAPSLACCRG